MSPQVAQPEWLASGGDVRGVSAMGLSLPLRPCSSLAAKTTHTCALESASAAQHSCCQLARRRRRERWRSWRRPGRRRRREPRRHLCQRRRYPESPSLSTRRRDASPLCAFAVRAESQRRASGGIALHLRPAPQPARLRNRPCRKRPCAAREIASWRRHSVPLHVRWTAYL